MTADEPDDRGRVIVLYPAEDESRREAAEALVDLAIGVANGSIDEVDFHWRPDRGR